MSNQGPSNYYPQPYPPPSPPLPPRRSKTPLIVAVVGGLVGLMALGGLVSNDDDSSSEPSGPAERMSLSAAACRSLNDGNDPDFVYEVMRDVAGNHPLTFPDPDIAARLAVTSAQNQGCGR